MPVLLAWLLAALALARGPGSEPIRVACLGDSITAGARIDEPRNRWPARLGYRLGDRYEVRGFGVSATTLLRGADRPYARTAAYARALEWRPQVAVVVLGTNDTCDTAARPNWRGAAALDADAAAFVRELRAASPRCRVLLATPPEMFPEAPGLDEARRADLRQRRPRLAEITSRLRAAAEATDAELVDLAGALRVEHVVDGVHPNPFGADAIAARVARAVEPAAGGFRPLPSCEFRGAAAGWGGGTWWDQLARLRTLAAEHPDAELVFLGDSITQGLTGAERRGAVPGGERAFDRYQGGRRALCLGLSGDRTEHVAWRVRSGALASLEPRVVVLQVGVNDVVAARRGAGEVAAGIEAVIDELRVSQPQAELLVCGPFPAGDDSADERRQAIDGVHARIAALGERARVRYLDLRGLFLDADGRPNERMRADHIHITPAGQEAWMEALEPTLASLFAAERR